MAQKIASKMIKYGIIRQSPDASAASAFKAAGSEASQWLNPAAADQNFRTVYYTAGNPMPDPGVTVDNYNVTSQLGLNHEISNFYIDQRSGLAKLSFAGPADLLTLKPHLIAAMQAVNEAATTPFLASITSGFTAGTLDFNGGSGFLHTLAIKQGASADDGTILENAIIDTLNLTFDFNAKGVGRLVQMDGSWVGNEMNFEQTLSGTWVETTLTPMNRTVAWTIDTFSVDSVDWKAQCIRRIVVSINNNVSTNCSTTAGKPNQYDVTPEYTITLVLDHNSTTEKLMGDFQTGAAVDFNFYNNYGDTTGQFNLDAPYCRVIAPPMAYNGDFLGYSIQLRAYQSSTTSPFTFAVADALDWGY